MIGPLDTVAYETVCRVKSWEVMPIVLIEADSGVIFHITHSAASIFGYHPEELLSQRIEVLVPEEFKQSHEGWRTNLKSSETRMMGRGRKVSGIKKDGERIPLHVGITTVQIFDKIIGLGYIVDLSPIGLKE